MGIFRGTIPIFRPKVLSLPIKNMESALSENIITNPGRTSLLTILIILMKISPKSINIVGFDMGKVKKKHYANLKFYQNSKASWTENDLKQAKIIFKKILIILDKKNIKFKNYSIFKLNKI